MGCSMPGSLKGVFVHMLMTAPRTAAAFFAALMVPMLASAQTGALSLKHGIYVEKPYPCKGAPNAGILRWDGVGLSGAHSSRCMTRVLSQAGTHYELSTTCSALGDGTADPSGYIDHRSLTRVSRSAFMMQAPHKEQQAFRWCSAKDVD
jgi:hypothetical protein